MKRQKCLDELLRELIEVTPDGKLFWKDHPSRPSFVGKQLLNCSSGSGYLCGKFRGHRLLAHRVVFFLTNGWWPEEVDHLNGNKWDNRPENLVGSSRGDNAKNRSLNSNNTSGGKRCYILQKLREV